MPKSITSAVGRGGRNFPPADVMTVQYLLNCVPAARGGPAPELTVDGAVGPKTIAAIEKFQRSLGGFADGRVDPGGATLLALQAKDPYPGQSMQAQTAKSGGPAGQKGGQFPGANKGGQFPPGGAKGGQYPPGAKSGQFPGAAKTGQFPGGSKGAGNDPFGQKGGVFPPGQWPGAKGGGGGGAKGF